MRIVLDTNILARATPGKSGPAAALRAAIRPPHLLIASPYLTTELAEVLAYARLRRLHGMSDVDINRFLTALQSDAVMVNVEFSSLRAVVPGDPKDDPIVSTAVNGRADYLCSLDKHLFNSNVETYCTQHGIQVVTDLHVLTLLRSA